MFELKKRFKKNENTQVNVVGGNRSQLKTISKKTEYNQTLKIDELLEKQFKRYNIQYFK